MYSVNELERNTLSTEYAPVTLADVKNQLKKCRTDTLYQGLATY